MFWSDTTGAISVVTSININYPLFFLEKHWISTGKIKAFATRINKYI